MDLSPSIYTQTDLRLYATQLTSPTLRPIQPLTVILNQHLVNLKYISACITSTSADDTTKFHKTFASKFTTTVKMEFD